MAVMKFQSYTKKKKKFVQKNLIQGCKFINKSESFRITLNLSITQIWSYVTFKIILHFMKDMCLHYVCIQRIFFLSKSVNQIIIYQKSVFNFVEPGWFFYFKSSDKDIIFLRQASMGIKNGLKKKKIFYVRKKNTLKTQHLWKIHRENCWHCFT